MDPRAIAAERDELCVNALRFLSVDAIERAGSGHPGLPLGAAPMAYVLWDRFLDHDPADPTWPDRDRFVLSAGHGSALLYSLLHLTGYDLPLDELKRFRQWGSRTPGHPEVDATPGVEATTGPLGQGFAMGVGMALAERFLGECFNTDEFTVVDHHTYALVSDGDLMEGISYEAASLAGTLGLGKLIYLYDDNHISIEGETDLAFREEIQSRFGSYGWHVSRVGDGNDLDAVEAGLEQAHEVTDRPSLVVVRTRIGYGSPKQDTAEVHGEPLGPEALEATRRRLGWPSDEPFHVPRAVREHMRRARDRGREKQATWRRTVEAYEKEHPELAERLRRQLEGELPEGWEGCLPTFGSDEGPVATRSASGAVLNALTGTLPELIGGSADLAPSTKTTLVGYGDFGFDEACRRNLHFGVREHAMGGVVNGMALHGGVLPYGATFLVFSDYMRPSLRLSALMDVASVFVFTHDSIGLGEDGPTHQPVEQLISLRAIPGFQVVRPADANEVAAGWHLAVTSEGPTALVLTRQEVPTLEGDPGEIRGGAVRGGYVLRDGEDDPKLIFIATGSEVHLAVEAHERLTEEGVASRVVSLPCWGRFAAQPRRYRDEVLPPEVRARVGVEAGAPDGWRRWVGDRGEVVAVRGFGASAPGEEVLQRYGFQVDDLVETARDVLRASDAATAASPR